MKRTHVATTPPITEAQVERLAGLVRLIRKPVEDGKPDPRNPPHEVKAAALAALGAWADVWHTGDIALDRAVDYSAGISASSSVEGHGKGGHSDPTPDLVDYPPELRRNGGDPADPDFVPMPTRRPDSFKALGQHLNDAVIHGAAHALVAVATATKILSSAPPVTDSDRARCQSFDVGCEEYAVKQGYCSPCAQWIYDNDGTTPVPKTVIQARRDKAALRAATSTV